MLCSKFIPAKGYLVHSISRLSVILALNLILSGLLGLRVDAAPPTAKSASPPRVLTRIFFQDDDARALKWADVLAAEPPRLGAVRMIKGFPTLDIKRQNLVQMEVAKGKLLVGVRDDDDGKFQSGWVLIDTGVEEDNHGDHSHWDYPRPPTVLASVLDEKQGNPAHVYCYDDVFYLANDKLGGFTRFDPAGIKRDDDVAKIRSRAVRFSGGGGHITLAAAGGKVAYSTWIDRDGPNKGRVDVTSLAGDSKVQYSLNLPHGGIHGATTCYGKAFFAPSDGLCWIKVNSNPNLDPKTIQVNHVSLGKDGEKPRRTGSFEVWGNCVGFVTGSGSNAAAGFIDASRSVLEVVQVPLHLADGSRPVGPSIVKPRRGAPLALVFHDHPADVESTCKLSLIELNLAADGNLVGGKRLEVKDVGNCRVDGHSGHHAVGFDDDRRAAIFTNPGDGTLTLLSLEDRKKVAEFRVGGVPSKIVCVGGSGTGH
ncbi:MAG: hypothetical protein JWN70_6344 [Planctomycetaceae bacterium]|nr:hypothetical protein [Planctomycetaceae bacterium]